MSSQPKEPADLGFIGKAEYSQEALRLIEGHPLAEMITAGEVQKFQDPFFINLVIDHSYSVDTLEAITAMNTAIDVLRRSAMPGTLLGICAFGDEGTIKMVTPFVHISKYEHPLLPEVLENTVGGTERNRTALYEAIYRGCSITDLQRQAVQDLGVLGRSATIIITDGKNNTGEQHLNGAISAVKVLRESEIATTILIYHGQTPDHATSIAQAVGIQPQNIMTTDKSNLQDCLGLVSQAVSQHSRTSQGAFISAEEAFGQHLKQIQSSWGTKYGSMTLPGGGA